MTQLSVYLIWANKKQGYPPPHNICAEKLQHAFWDQNTKIDCLLEPIDYAVDGTDTNYSLSMYRFFPQSLECFLLKEKKTHKNRGYSFILDCLYIKSQSQLAAVFGSQILYKESLYWLIE